MSSDDVKKPFTLINSPIDVSPRNYWNTSGSGREFFPTEPRVDSIPTFNKQGRVIAEPKDEWWINSEKHHFCFWTFIKERSQPDGTMEPLLQSEIAELFGCSSTKVHFMLKEALDHLTSEENMKLLQNLLELTFGEPEDEIYPLSSMNELDKIEDDEEQE
jgi:hypothetical protein